MEDALGLVDWHRFVDAGMDDLGLDRAFAALGLEKALDVLGLEKALDALGLEKALDDPSVSTKPLESTSSSTRTRTSLLRIVIISMVVLVIKYLQPLHELQIVLRTTLDQPLHIDVLQVN